MLLLRRSKCKLLERPAFARFLGSSSTSLHLSSNEGGDKDEDLPGARQRLSSFLKDIKESLRSPSSTARKPLRAKMRGITFLSSQESSQGCPREEILKILSESGRKSLDPSIPTRNRTRSFATNKKSTYFEDFYNSFVAKNVTEGKNYPRSVDEIRKGFKKIISQSKNSRRQSERSQPNMNPAARRQLNQSLYMNLAENSTSNEFDTAGFESVLKSLYKKSMESKPGIESQSPEEEIVEMESYAHLRKKFREVYFKRKKESSSITELCEKLSNLTNIYAKERDS